MRLKKSLLPVIAIALLSLALIVGNKVDSIEKPDMSAVVNLSGIIFMGNNIEIKVPAIYGDFYETHSVVEIVPVGFDIVGITFAPDSGEGNMYVLVAKAECPEMVALMAYNPVDKSYTWWLYDAAGLPHLATEAEVDVVIDGPHPCNKEFVKTLEV